MQHFHLTQASLLLPSVTALRKRGVAVDVYLRESNIPEPLIHQSYAPLPKKSHFWHFLDDIERIEGLETVGFLFGEPIDLRMLGPWGRNVLRAHSLLEALTHASKTIRHLAQGNTIHIKRHKGKALISFSNEEDVACHAADHSCLKVLLSLVEMVAPDWMPSYATLRTSRLESVEALPCFHDCQLSFGASRTCLEIPEEFLSRPLPHPHLDHEFEHDLTSLPQGKSIAPKLQVVIAALLPYLGPLPAEEAASILGISRTTLFRQLTREGESYRRLVESVRYRVARKMLAQPAMSVKEVAYTLGYQTPNNFTRAFRRIAGISPGLFRHQIEAGIAQVA